MGTGCKRLMIGVSRWLVGRQIGRCAVDLTMDTLEDEVNASLPWFLVEAAAELGWQDVQQSAVHSLHTHSKTTSPY